MILPLWVKPAAIALVAVAAYGYGRLQQAESDQAERDRERVEELERVGEWVKARIARAAELAAQEVKEREKIRVVFERVEKEVERIVDRPVYRECALDDDGLRAWNEANSYHGEAGSDSAGAVSSAPDAGRPDAGGGASESR